MDLELVQSAFAALGVPPPPTLVLLEARVLEAAHVPPYPPDCPALLTEVGSRARAIQARDVLLRIYPGTHAVQVIEGSVRREQELSALGNDNHTSPSTCWFVPALPEGTSFEAFAEIVAHLRAPDGCPWDREQTHESLRKHLLEEAYETLEAIDAADFTAMQEEFGDLLLQVVLQTQIAAEAGHFNLSRVLQGIHNKLVRRHPHVFGNVEVEGVGEVLANWEKLKEKERGGKTAQKGLLDGIPAALPALSQAQEYQDRAARVGFDWPEIEGVLEKVAEEVEEIRQAQDERELAAEIGDLLFALVNLARWKNVDAESVLRETNLRFKRRFAHVENGAREHGKPLSGLTLVEMDALWEEGKKREG